MTTHRVAVLMLWSAGAALAQQGLLRSDAWTGSLDVRNRWVSDIGGSSQAYRSVVNLGEGPRLFDVDLRFSRPGARWADSASLTMNSWGGDPYNTVHFAVEKKGLYDLRFDYRNIAYFNDLPSFANPLLGDGVTLSQRSLDTQRRQMEVDLELWPTRTFSPFVGVSSYSGRGRGVTTFVSGGNEFAVDTDLDDQLLTARGGVTASGERWSLILEQGFTDFSDGQEVSWDRSPNLGNRKFPLLGQDLVLDRLLQQYAADGRGLFSRAVVQARPWSRLAVTGQFIYSQPKINVTQEAAPEGEFVYLPLLAPYSFALERSVAQASRPRSSGNWTTEIRLHRRLRMVQSWYTDQFHVAGSAAISQILNTTPELSIEDQLDRRLVLDYNQNQVDLIFEPDRRISIRAGHRYAWGDAETPPPSFDLRPEPKTRGAMRRHVGLASVAARLAGGRLRIGVQAEVSSASEIYFRTGLRDYWRGKLRASYRILPTLTVQSSFTAFENHNDDSQIELDTKSQQLSAGFSWTPRAQRDWSVAADYTRSTLTSKVLTIQLPFYGTDFAHYRDDGHFGSVYIQTGLVYSVRLQAGGSLFIGSGSRPTRFYTPQVELDGRVSERVRWVGEWRWYGFSETVYPVEDFRTHTFSAGIRLSL